MPIKRSEFNYMIYLFRRLFFNRLVRFGLIIFLVVLILPFVIFFILRPSVQNDINYGVTFSNKYANDLGLDWQGAYVEILDGLKIKNIRLVAYWDEIESQRDVYDFSTIIWQLDEAQKRDINVILTIGRKVPRYPECHEPKWWKAIENKEIRDVELYEYIKHAVASLENYDAIKVWQVENESFFPFGDCKEIKSETVRKEVDLVRSMDIRPILIQDSGEGGFWFPSYKIGDYLGISMYRKIWYDFWNVFLGRFIYFQYPLAHWTYKIKAGLVGVPYEKIVVTELQAEPWGPDINSVLSQEEKDKTMSRHDFISTINYAQKAGFKDLYFWGVEWWLWEKQKMNNPYFWDTARALLN